MVEDPADGIIAEVLRFGAKAFDTATALKVMLNEATVPNNIRPGSFRTTRPSGTSPTTGRTAAATSTAPSRRC